MKRERETDDDVARKIADDAVRTKHASALTCTDVPPIYVVRRGDYFYDREEVLFKATKPLGDGRYGKVLGIVDTILRGEKSDITVRLRNNISVGDALRKTIENLNSQYEERIKIML